MQKHLECHRLACVTGANDEQLEDAAGSLVARDVRLHHFSALQPHQLLPRPGDLGGARGDFPVILCYRFVGNCNLFLDL